MVVKITCQVFNSIHVKVLNANQLPILQNKNGQENDSIYDNNNNNNNRLEQIDHKTDKNPSRDFKEFLDLNGYSKSPFKTAFGLVCLAAMFAACAIYVYQNVQSFQAYQVVTHTKSIDEESMTFPAVTFCLITLQYESLDNFSFTSSYLTTEKLLDCRFEFSYKCSINDFEQLPIYFPMFDKSMRCYRINGGSHLLSATKGGMFSGLILNLNLSKSEKFFFAVHANREEPIYSELGKIIEQSNGKSVHIEFKKTVEIKLPMPYSNCTENINPETSYLVREIISRNVSYRKKYCYELCFYGYLKEYAAAHGIPNFYAYTRLVFDYGGNCSRLCPLECGSTSFDLSTSEIAVENGFLTVCFYFFDRKYTEITQTVKTTGADLISNIGGVLGLFMELSFVSAYRFVLFVFDFIF